MSKAKRLPKMKQQKKLPNNKQIKTALSSRFFYVRLFEVFDRVFEHSYVIVSGNVLV